MENKNFKITLFLVDGSSFLYRAYYGLKPLHTLDGRPVQAVYGFVRMVKKIMDTFDPHKFVLVWDSKGKTERHEIFPAYKETRQAPPSDLFEQKELINEFADLIELHQIALPGIEADDIIYSLAKDASQASENVIVISSDKDLYQMIDDNVHIFDPFKNTIVNQEDFEADKGFPVNKLSFYYALLGDSSDNIPGVRGIGKKGAVELVQNFDNLQNLYDNIDKVEKPRLKSALEANKDNAFLSEQLFKLRYHKLDIPELGFMFDKNKWSNAQSLFKQLNFRSLIQDSGKKESKQLSLLPQSEHLSIKKKYNFKPVLTKQDLDKVVEQIKKEGAFATDTETTGINPFCDRWIGISIATHTGESFYIPTGHKDAQVQQLTQEQVVAALKPVLENPSIKKYLHNAKFDMHVLQQGGVVMQGLDFDTMIAASLAVEDWQSVGLKQLSEVILKEPMLTYSMVINEVKAKDFADVPIDLATEYAAADAHQTLQLYNYFKSILTESKLLDLYEKIEHPVIQVLTDMEAEGIYLDTDILKVLGDQVTQEISNIEAAIRDLVGSEVINLNSPKQIEDLLFNQLGLPPQKRKKTGYSTDQEVLEALSKLHPVPNLLLKYRELTKIQGTYIAEASLE